MTSALNDPIYDLGCYKVQVPDIRITDVSESQISTGFALEPAVVELQVILGKCTK